MDYQAFFNQLHPGFFRKAYIRSLPEDAVYREMLLDLRTLDVPMAPVAAPPDVSFRVWDGPRALLLDAVAAVDSTWLQWFREPGRVFCAVRDGEPVSFCMLGAMGSYEGLRIGGPGCVGTVPRARRQGIGLRMVQLGTEILKQEGFDYSYIHYTGVAPWYARLGYRTVLTWNARGFLSDDPAHQTL